MPEELHWDPMPPGVQVQILPSLLEVVETADTSDLHLQGCFSNLVAVNSSAKGE